MVRPVFFLYRALVARLLFNELSGGQSARYPFHQHSRGIASGWRGPSSSNDVVLSGQCRAGPVAFFFIVGLDASFLIAFKMAGPSHISLLVLAGHGGRMFLSSYCPVSCVPSLSIFSGGLGGPCRDHFHPHISLFLYLFSLVAGEKKRLSFFTT